ncbi:MAG: pre-rRNA-processing protein PNO1 [Candidatus Aenigmatarchaeota archaeon]
MIESIQIPEERKAVLIGKKGEVKEELETDTGTSIRVNELVEIEGEPPGIYQALEAVKAIGRGFNPEHAFLLLEEGYQLHVISLHGEKPATIKRLMGRVIGRKGVSRRIIEQSTGTHISVYGKTVSIIGEWEGVEKAREAVEALLAGRKHGGVYRRLEGK